MLRKIIGSLAALTISQAALAETHFTTKCSQFGHPEFQFSVTSNTIPRTDVAWFMSMLESMVAAGEQFKAGETMQVGWMLTMLQDGDKGALKVTEPDMKSVPIKFVDTVDTTIKHLRAQKDHTVPHNSICIVWADDFSC